MGLPNRESGGDGCFLTPKVQRLREGATHPGLFLDKFCALTGEMKDQKDILDAAVGRFTSFAAGEGKGLPSELGARRKLREASLPGASSFELKTRTPLTLHLSRGAALENAGLCTHRIYGLPMLPGTGLKGLARAYAETVARAPAEEVHELFGSPADEREGRHAGKVGFHDALPTEWPKLTVDIANNHHEKYYGESGEPGDWEGPIPIYFLSIETGATFHFTLHKLDPGVPDSLVDKAREWLVGGLVHLGAGAKTSVGYGCFAPPSGLAPKGRELTLTYELELLTPGFFAGAGQKVADCTLRAASLKGQLRWWWRTMHAAYLSASVLRDLEGRIWGDTTHGQSWVELRIEKVGPEEAKTAPFVMNGKPHDAFNSRHDIPKKGLGIRYASYGMTDGRKHRPVVFPGAHYAVTLAVRGERADLTSAIVQREAEAALWLLLQHGAVGAKSRKGFGALRITRGSLDLSIESVRDSARATRKALSLPSGTCIGALSIDGLAFTATVHMQLSDPWTLMDTIGQSYQAVAGATGWKHNEKKKALGLPRQIHGPWKEPQSGQVDHKPPLRLRAGALDRHTSPFCVGVRRETGLLVVELLAFTAARLPSAASSSSVLAEFGARFQAELEARRGRATPSKEPPAPLVRPVRSEDDQGTRVRMQRLEVIEMAHRGKGSCTQTLASLRDAITIDPGLEPLAKAVLEKLVSRAPKDWKQWQKEKGPGKPDLLAVLDRLKS